MFDEETYILSEFLMNRHKKFVKKFFTALARYHRYAQVKIDCLCRFDA